MEEQKIRKYFALELDEYEIDQLISIIKYRMKQSDCGDYYFRSLCDLYVKLFDLKKMVS